MRFVTSSGRYVTAATKDAAARMAAEYGMGDIVRAVQAAQKPAAPMPLATAVRLFAQAEEWPRCGQDWPATARERQAAAVIAANPGCVDGIW